jgi:hypothetical protein
MLITITTRQRISRELADLPHTHPCVKCHLAGGHRLGQVLQTHTCLFSFSPTHSTSDGVCSDGHNCWQVPHRGPPLATAQRPTDLSLRWSGGNHPSAFWVSAILTPSVTSDTTTGWLVCPLVQHCLCCCLAAQTFE